MTKHKHSTRRRNKLHTASTRRPKTRRPKTRRPKTRRPKINRYSSSSLILRKRIGGSSSINYEPRDLFDPNLDTTLERSVYTDYEVTQEERNRYRLYSLLTNLGRRIHMYPDNPRISVWNELFNHVDTVLLNDDIDAITRIANEYDNARQLVQPELPDFHPDMMQT